MPSEQEDKRSEQLDQEQKLLQQVQAAENTSKQYMTKEAIQRYGNLKLTHPQIAIRAIFIISKAVQTGQLKQKIDDLTFKKILSQIQDTKQNFRIIK